ncbi:MULTISPECIES: DNA cytosine methyltransferase [unclassified Cyanobium]|uniref:DNA cytosine methyltransferase n=1 Tax=unclassified Cyanobium TaxID=2627006 RepID=UPI0020CC8459|nr:MULTISPECIES: DNA cytosine methyltransferase [unclassified Cyanobium]MCP9835848.1 DNA cytosine methyltransferase [Cyanobium sp. La Preciosa 7G6]MCP9938598.1 DNA cytosine methyltransferase [Cyanobium sp. Aljojuca 7A6]
MLDAIELFTGAGGLGMGIHHAGFHPRAVVEWDKWACDTIRENQSLGNSIVASWPVHQMDVRQFDFSALNGPIDLIAGGPPCQPFSMGGKHNGRLDRRDMFPPTLEAIRIVRPKAFIIENVKGLTRKCFHNYLQYITLQMKYPDLVILKEEGWLNHLHRLQRADNGNTHEQVYKVTTEVLNAANFGVPQKRERIFFVGIKVGLDIPWAFPDATHSSDALWYDQWVTGEYWDRNEVSLSDRPSRPDKSEGKLERLKASPPAEKAWSTVREVLHGLPDPETSAADCFLDHRYQAGARSYAGHTGSAIDEPAKTLKAGVHGVPGGENMLRKNDGSIRYFTIREAARLQTFPDDYRFHGSWSEVMRQLGNAVPVELGRVVATSIAASLTTSKRVSN